MRNRLATFKPLRQSWQLAIIAAGMAGISATAKADDMLRVGKSVPEPFSFTPLDIGMQKGFFKKHGLDIQETAFGGDAKLQQAMAADSIDVGIGSGPAMAFIAKGSPVKAIAAMAGPPLLLAIVVRPDGPKTVADLKGKKVSVSTAGSLTYFLVSETSRSQGWGPNGIDIEPMGAMPGQIAALKRGDIDGIIMDVGNAFELEKKGEGRILVRFTQIEGFYDPCDLRDRQGYRQQARRSAQFPQGLVRDHRVHAREQGRNGEDRRADHRQRRRCHQPQL